MKLAKVTKIEHKIKDTGYLRQKFGDCVYQIGLDTKMKLKMSIKDVHRALYNTITPEVESICKGLPTPPQGIDDHDFVYGYDDNGTWIPGLIETNPFLRMYIDKYPKEWEIVEKTLGMVRQSGRHPCAFLISSQPIDTFIPVTTTGGVRVTGYTASSVESAGGLKMDFLVVNSIHDIQSAVEIIKRRHEMVEPLNEKAYPSCFQVPDPRTGKALFIYNLPQEVGVYHDLCTGKVETVFQLDAEGARKGLLAFAPENGVVPIKNIEGLAAFVALDRPGPLDAYVGTGDKKHNMLVEYSRRAKGLEPTGRFPVLDQMIPETYGILCVAKDSKVWLDRGIANIQDVQDGDLVRTETGEFRPVIKKMYNGQRKVIRVRLSSGEELSVTPDHKVLTQVGWVEAGDLTRYHLVKQFWPTDVATIDDGSDEDWLIGLLAADGNLCTTSPDLACSTKEFAEKTKTIADRVWGLDSTIYLHGTCWHLRLARRGGNAPSAAIASLKAAGLWGKDFSKKRLPPRPTKAMLAGLFEGDGSVKNNRLRVKNEGLARDFFYGLQAAHIPCSLYQAEEGVWCVSLLDNSLPLKIKSFPISCRKGDFVPVPKGKIPRNDNRRQLLYKKICTREAAASLKSDYPYLETDLSRWGRVLSIRNGKETEVFDLTVEDIHSFCVGGSIVHNCYQEQLTKIYQNLGGTTSEEADEFRVHVSKKQVAKVIQDKAVFMKGAVARIGLESAEALWGSMETFANYGFNLSHAVSYSIITYACAWLKHHYPLEWWTAVLRNASKDDIETKFWPYCNHLVKPPDLSKSSENFTIDGNHIRAPLSILKGIGDSAHKEILEGMPYASLADFLQKIEDRRDRTGTTVTKTTEKNGAQIVQTVKKKGRSSINSKISNLMIISGAMDQYFNPGMSLEEKIIEFERQKLAITKKRAKSTASQFAGIDSVSLYQIQKGVNSTLSRDIRNDLAGLEPEYVKKVLNGDRHQYIFKDGTIILSGNKFKVFKESEMIPPQGVEGVFIAYVIGSKIFSFKSDGQNKTSCEYNFDIEGERFTSVDWDRKWPDLDRAIVALHVYRKPGKPIKLSKITTIRNEFVRQEPEESKE